jgi:hypothetical protein
MPSSSEEVVCWVTTSLVDEGWAVTAFVTAGLTEAALGAAGVFGAGFLGLAVLLVAVTIGFRDLGRDGVGSRGSRYSIDNTTPSDNVAPPLAKFHPLVRGLDPLRFRGRRFARSGAFWAPFRRPLC